MPAASLAAAQSGSSQICPDCGTPRATPDGDVLRGLPLQFRHADIVEHAQSAGSARACHDACTPPVASALPTSPPMNARRFHRADCSRLLRPMRLPLLSPRQLPRRTRFGRDRQRQNERQCRQYCPQAQIYRLRIVNAAPRRIPLPATIPDSGLTQAPILRWEALLTVDPSLNVDPDPNLPCPIGEPERVFPLDFADNLIGRRSDKRDIHPEITVNDPCASHRHAKLQRQPDGSFALLDVGSTNGTQLNGVDVQPGVRTPLSDGDQITLGCWTRITIRGLRS